MKLPMLHSKQSTPTVNKAQQEMPASSSLKVLFAPYFKGVNPYQKQLDEALGKLGIGVDGADYNQVFLPPSIQKAEAKILHLHWLHSFYKADTLVAQTKKLIKFVVGLLLLKLTKTRIVWTAHNLKNHETINAAFDHFCTKLVAWFSNAIIAHGESAKAEIIANLQVNPEKITVIPHANYIDYYQNNISRQEARSKLGIADSTLVLLFFGWIRPYKGITELVEVFKQLPQQDVQLWLVGKVLTEEISQEIQQQVAGCSMIRFQPGLVDDDEVQVYMNASDAVVLPYRNILTSGAAILAMSFGKACIAPCIPGLSEVLDEAGSVLYNPQEPNGLTQAINHAIAKQPELAAMGQHNRQLAEQWSWERIAAMTANVYRQCLSH